MRYVLPAFCLAALLANAQDFTSIPFKSAAAQDAIKAFERDRHELQSVYAAELVKVRVRLLERLQEARKAALTANDLDEAQAIVAAIKQTEGTAGLKIEAPADPVPVQGVRFEMLQARWGAGDAWVDATREVRAYMGANRPPQTAEALLKAARDPKPGAMKSLVVVYAINGRVNVTIYPQAQRVTTPQW